MKALQLALGSILIFGATILVLVFYSHPVIVDHSMSNFDWTSGYWFFSIFMLLGGLGILAGALFGDTK